MKRILVATDGSEASHKAIRFAADLLRPVEGELTLAFVVTPVAYPTEIYGATASALDEALNRFGKTVLEQAAQIAKEAGVREVRTQILIGSPAEALAEAAEGGDFELVAVGNRGRGAVARVLLGSVSDRLVHICKKPVVVVR